MVRPTLRLDGSLVRDLCLARFKNGAAGLLDSWEQGRGLHRATLHRWLAGGLPGSAEALLHLAAQLDTDPVALLALDKGDVVASTSQLVTAFQTDYWKPALKFIKDFSGRQAEWPPSALAHEHFHRDWFKFDFKHTAAEQRNLYATVRLSSARQTEPCAPQVYHFAFRHKAHFGRRWLQYGVVLRSRERVALIHIGGQTDSYSVLAPADATTIETYFGESPAEFRIASLHPFGALVLPLGASSHPTVRFFA